MGLVKRAPEWRNVGVEPPEELRNDGFRAGYKPPAAYFNWFFNRIYEAVGEIQGALKGLAFKDSVEDGDIIGISAVKIAQDSGHRMVSDDEKNRWDSISNTAIVAIPASSWGATAPYMSTVAVAGLREADRVRIYPHTPKEIGAAATRLRRRLTALITDGESRDGEMVLYCAEKRPTEDFEVLLEGVSIHG